MRVMRVMRVRPRVRMGVRIKGRSMKVGVVGGDMREWKVERNPKVE